MPERYCCKKHRKIEREIKMENVWKFSDAKNMDSEEALVVALSQFGLLSDEEKKARDTIAEPMKENRFYFEPNYFQNMTHEELNRKHNPNGKLTVTEHMRYALQSAQNFSDILDREALMFEIEDAMEADGE